MANAATPAWLKILIQLWILQEFVKGLLLFDSLFLTHQTFTYTQQKACFSTLN